MLMHILSNISCISQNALCRGVRPFGVSLLICGWDNNRPFLFQCDPSVSQLRIIVFQSHVNLQGAYFPWKATAMGKNYINGKTFLEKRYILYAGTHLLLVVPHC